MTVPILVAGVEVAVVTLGVGVCSIVVIVAVLVDDGISVSAWLAIQS